MIDHSFTQVMRTRSTILLTTSFSSRSGMMKSHFNHNNSMREQMGILIQAIVGAISTDREATNLVALASTNERNTMADNVLKINQPLRGRKVKTAIEAAVVKVIVLLEGVLEVPKTVLDTTEWIKCNKKVKATSIIITTIKAPKVGGVEEGNSLTLRINTIKNTKMIGRTSNLLSSSMMKSAKTSNFCRRHKNQRKNTRQSLRMSLR